MQSKLAISYADRALNGAGLVMGKASKALRVGNIMEDRKITGDFHSLSVKYKLSINGELTSSFGDNFEECEIIADSYGISNRVHHSL